MHRAFLHHSAVRVNRPPLKEQLRWQCRRGMLELDLLFSRFLDIGYADLTDDERADFVRLLGYQDLIDKIRGI